MNKKEEEKESHFHMDAVCPSARKEKGQTPSGSSSKSLRAEAASFTAGGDPMILHEKILSFQFYACAASFIINIIVLRMKIDNKIEPLKSVKALDFFVHFSETKGGHRPVFSYAQKYPPPSDAAVGIFFSVIRRFGIVSPVLLQRRTAAPCEWTSL